MGKVFENLHLVLAIGLGLALALMAGIPADSVTAEALLRWLHVFFGILWIGLLYYFNFVQIPVMPSVPAELKPGVSKFIAPKALFFFRWGAALTVLTGAVLAIVKNYLIGAPTLRDGFGLIGIGAWLAFRTGSGETIQARRGATRCGVTEDTDASRRRKRPE